MKKYDYKCSKNVFENITIEATRNGCTLFPIIFEIFFFFVFFFGILNAAVPSVLNPNNPSVLETWYAKGGG